MRSNSLQIAALLAPSAVLAGLPLSPASSTPTVSLLLPYNGASFTYLGSVITAAPSSTEYAVTCAPFPASASASASSSPEDGDFCGPEFTITQGPSVWAFAFTVAGEETMSAKCEGDIVNTKALTCTQSVGGPSLTGDEAGVSTTVMQPSEWESVVGAVTVTAGGDLLTGGASASATETPSASATGATSGKASSKTGSLTTITGTASPTSSATGAAASTGAATANMVKQGAVVGMAGVVLAALAL